MSDKRPREFWIRQELFNDAVKSFPMNDGYIHVREIIELASLKIPEFDESATKDKAETQCSLGVYQADGFKRGARYQHSIDQQHFDAMVGELMSVIEEMRESLKYLSRVDSETVAEETLASADEKLKRLKGE